MRRTVVVTGHGPRTVVLVLGDVEVIVGRLDGLRPDLAMVDALARLQLAARHLGWSIRVRNPCQQLCELLELVGLADVVACEPGLPLEPHRKAEGGKQLGVEEVVPPGDPSV